ncbi:LOW QUALITY PROTEIN: cadherin-related family member 4 [Ciconia maguari]
MGTHGSLTFLLLLLSLRAPGTFVRAAALPDLPRVVALSEDAAPGTRVAKVTVSCSNVSGSPNVTLHGIEPGHPFNPIAISADPVATATFQAEVTLRAGAELDAHQVNQYTLTLRAACPGEDEVEERLFVRVTVGQVLRCDAPFASAEGDMVQVLADTAPRTPLYAVLPQPLGGLTFRLRNHDTPLALTRRGLVLAPASGFDPSKDTQTYRLEIDVMDRHGHNCSGVVTVEVLPSRRPRVTFLEPQRAVTVPEGTGPLEVVTQVHASGDNIRYAIVAPTVPALFTIDEVTGEIRSTCQLEVAHARLLIRAYNVLHPTDHATTVLNITVQGTDQRAPSCIPALSVSRVPETVSPGSTLVTLRCTDPAGAEGGLRYALEGPPASRSRFRMEGPRLQVNSTLDYDSEAVAAVGFQFTATVVVTAGGQPPRSTFVPVFVTVTPVNEFTPTCPNGAAFTVLETAAFGSTVGRVAGTDRDYPLDSLEYSLEGGPGPAQPFSIDTRTGEIRVVGPLDSQRHKSYRLTVRLTDTRNDLDPAKRRSRLCDVAVRLQAVPDQAPVCTPEVQELRMTARLGGRQPVTRLACQGSPDGAALAYAVAGGNEDGRFQLEGNTLFYLPDDLAEPRTFVLLVEVWGGPGVPRRSTVVALVVHITPQSTPVTPSTTTRHMTLRKEPLVVMRTEAAWHPPAWFVAVLTVSGALLLAALGCVARSLLCSNQDPDKTLGKRWVLHGQGGWIGGKGQPCTLAQAPIASSQAAGRCSAWGVFNVPRIWLWSIGRCARELSLPQGPVTDGVPSPHPLHSFWDMAEQRSGKEEWSRPHAGSPGQFDGCARDPRTGRDHLFNSVTGARRWI